MRQSQDHRKLLSAINSTLTPITQHRPTTPHTGGEEPAAPSGPIAYNGGKRTSAQKKQNIEGPQKRRKENNLITKTDVKDSLFIKKSSAQSGSTKKRKFSEVDTVTTTTDDHESEDDIQPSVLCELVDGGGGGVESDAHTNFVSDMRADVDVDGAHPSLAAGRAETGAPNSAALACPFCPRVYNSWGYRRRHVKTTHLAHRLSCAACGAAAASPRAWYRHAVRAHATAPAAARDALVVLGEAHAVLTEAAAAGAPAGSLR